MLKDIDFKKVEDTAMAVVREVQEGEETWYALPDQYGTKGTYVCTH